MDAQEKLRQKYPLIKITTKTQINTPTINIRFQASEKNKNEFAAKRINNELLIIYYRPDIIFESTETQNKIKYILKQFLLKEAIVYLPQRLQLLATKHSFYVNNIKINAAKTRWGSCSTKKNINLSLYLMLLPEQIIDFILVHELCHTEQMNHGREFKNRMKSIFPNYTELNIQLKAENKNTQHFK